MLRAITRLLVLLGFRSGHQLPGIEPPDAEREPHAWRPVPRKPRPTLRSSAVAVVEPDE